MEPERTLFGREVRRGRDCTLTVTWSIHVPDDMRRAEIARTLVDLLGSGLWRIPYAVELVVLDDEEIDVAGVQRRVAGRLVTEPDREILIALRDAEHAIQTMRRRLEDGLPG